ncbi:flagellar basal body-associated FliL family protein [Paracidovorax citrulli]|uniref:Flagellar protein FliL n=1 Tax=Paracidovorax citrulli TaxID=80869 RepID=A0ABY9ARP7_PARCI|nr:flagellar basal body-associated FliL family protein [Paracidovorax citrulli]ATG96524.1 flagellar basal body protein FliL [Paracidovorax citrulli]PVY64377.1 flagellar FliL protein [Paracidovorax citrulli]REG71423.1 flagellar FliL protein [Paracidovorax citrulli]RLJ95976.1 flagellar FliL protein [Paracidovorax citrulli]UMT85991.1 flagellar basal body protein FliL [Paracidovorax citrulli]
MSANPPAAAAAKPKSKKLVLIIAIVAVLVLAGGGAAWFFLSKRSHGDEDEEGGGGGHAKAAAPAAPKVAPTFLPIENMVVNLADPGGERFAQIGITLELADAKTSELVKQYLPSIRSAILMLVSQRTAQELLGREGKEKLAVDIRREVSKPLGYTVPKPRKRPASDEEEDGEEAPRPRVDNNPVRQVLFSSFIIQ